MPVNYDEPKCKSRVDRTNLQNLLLSSRQYHSSKVRSSQNDSLNSRILRELGCWISAWEVHEDHEERAHSLNCNLLPERAYLLTEWNFVDWHILIVSEDIAQDGSEDGTGALSDDVANAKPEVKVAVLHFADHEASCDGGVEVATADPSTEDDHNEDREQQADVVALSYHLFSYSKFDAIGWFNIYLFDKELMTVVGQAHHHN